MIRRRPSPQSSHSTTSLIDHLPSPYAWQRDAIAAWRNAGHRGVVEAVTGAGKTVVGVAAIRDAVTSGRKCLVLVPSIPLLTQWKERLEDFLAGIRVGTLGGGSAAAPGHHDVTVATIQSAWRRADDLLADGHGLLVADECHRYGADTFRRGLFPGHDWRLGLTGTYSREDDGNLLWLDPYFGGICFELDYARALSEKVVADFELSLVGVQLDEADRKKYEEHLQVAEQTREVLTVRCGASYESFADFIKFVTRLSGSAREWDQCTRAANLYLSAFHAYRRVLAESVAKVRALRGLREQIATSNGTLVFGETIASCERAARFLRELDITAAAIHSQLDRDERARILSRFGSGKLQAVCAPRVLDEGVDVPEANLGVILATSQSRRQMIQRMGRILRRKPDNNRATFAWIYARGTREDPDRGSQETFLEDVLPLASSVTWS